MARKNRTRPPAARRKVAPVAGRLALAGWLLSWPPGGALVARRGGARVEMSATGVAIYRDGSTEPVATFRPHANSVALLRLAMKVAGG